MRKNTPDIKNFWSILCTSSSIDQHSNNVSLFNLVEKFTVTLSTKDKGMRKADIETSLAKGVQVTISLQLLSLWKRTYAKTYPEYACTLRFEIIDPRGNITLIKDNGVVFQKGKRGMRFTMVFDKMTMKMPGDYVFKLSLLSTAGEVIDTSSTSLEVQVDIA